MFGKLIDKAFSSTGKKEYREAIINSLANGNFSQESRNNLRNLANIHQLSKDDLYYIHKDACSLLAKKAAGDYRITDFELSALDKLIEFTGLSPKDLDINFDELRKFHTIWLMEDQRKLPIMSCDGLNVIYKKDEHLHWAAISHMKKIKTITKRISYGGFTGSIKIAKGIHYRVGSLNVARSTEEILVTDDSGLFWLTNQRIGFIGQRKHFTLNFEKILSFELSSLGLILRKEGRETPYILQMDDYEVPCTMISHILNGDCTTIDLLDYLPTGNKQQCECGATLEPGWEYCPNCSKPLNASFCSKCGAPLQPGWQFCSACGRQI